MSLPSRFRDWMRRRARGDTPPGKRMSEFERRRRPRAAFMALVLVLSNVLTAVTPMAAMAAGGTSEVGDTVQVLVGHEIKYGGAGTSQGTMYRYVTQAGDGRVNPIYCIDPEKGYGPNDNGWYHTSDPVMHTSAVSMAYARAVMWFGWGGPGFDESMWPSKNASGGTMTANDYFAYTHILIADAVYGNGSKTLSGCSESVRNWISWNIMGYEWGHWNDSAYFNYSAPRWRINDKAYSGIVPGQDVFRVFQVVPQNSVVQTVWGFFYYPTFDVKLYKASNNTNVTNGNQNYSLGNAVYGIYKSDGTYVGSMTTDSTGYAHYEGLTQGSYYVKEISPSPGYALDTNTYSFTGNSGDIKVVRVKEKPQGDPLLIDLQKIDRDTGQAVPEGAASLAGAQFRVNYYKGSSATGSPDASWVLKTDANGKAKLKPEYLVSGSPFYYTSTGLTMVPLGTVTVQEIKAPEGYDLNDEVQTIRVTSQGNMESVHVGNFKSTPDDVWRGGVRVAKVDADTGANQPQGDATLAGAVFSVVSLNDNPVKVNGTVYNKGDVVLTLTTDESGHAQSGAAVLPYGSYRIYESKAPEGYNLNREWQQEFTISQKGQIRDFTSPAVRDPVVRGGIKVSKRDFDLDEIYSQGDASFAGAEFQITNRSARAVYVDGTLYQPGAVVKTIVTDASGVATTASDTLPYGTYEIKETKAPEGYKLNSEWSRTFEIRNEGQILDHTGSYTSATGGVSEQVFRGGVGVRKVDFDTQVSTPQGDASLQGAEFSIVNDSAHDVVVDNVRYAPGDVVKVITTDANGVARTQADTLPYGSYTITETKAPEGYHVNTEWTRSFTIRSDNQWVSYEQDTDTTADKVQRGGVEVNKKDLELDEIYAQGDSTLEGAEYQITNKSAQSVYVDGHLYQPGEVVKTIVTDKTGHAATAADSLPYGTYTIKETKAPVGYHLNTEWSRDFTIRYEGEIQSFTSIAEATPEQIIRGGLTVPKLDHDTDTNVPQGDATLAGAEFTIWNMSAHDVLVDGQRKAPGEVVKVITTDAGGVASTEANSLPYGTYKVKETKAPVGYLLNTEWEQTVSVQQEGVIVDVPKVTDPVKRGGVKLQKIDHELNEAYAQGDATLEGAKITITNRSVEAVYVNGVLYQPGDIVATITTDVNGATGLDATTLPYGTYEANEVAAPVGYLLNSDWSVTFQVREEGVIVDKTGDPVADDVQRGGLKVRKADNDTRASNPQGDATLAGAEFTIVNASAHDVLVDGARKKPGEIVKVITTGEDGGAATAADSLPYGTYTVTETKAPEGYRLNTEWTRTVEIRAHGQIADLTADADMTLDEVQRGGVKVQKIDHELQENYAQGDATLAGAVLDIVNKSAHPVWVDGKLYQVGDVVKSITTDEGGVAVADKDALPYGTYEIHESKAPAGYLPNTDWSVTFQVRNDGEIVDITGQKLEDQVIRGNVSVRKADNDTRKSAPQGDATLAGAEFEIKNVSPHDVLVNNKRYKSGEVVATIVAGEDGVASIAERALPYGTYEVRETKAPEGYRLNGEWVKTFSIREENQHVDLTSDADMVLDEVQRGGVKVQKIDHELQENYAQGDATLAGAELSIVNKSEHPVYVDGKLYDVDQVVKVITTDENGVAVAGKDALPYGTYEIHESKEPEGYLPNTDWSVTFQVRTDGEIVDITNQKLEDQVIRGGVKVRKVDADTLRQEQQGDATLAGAEFSIKNKSGHDVLVDGKRYKTDEVVKVITTDEAGDAATDADTLPYGTYEVTETKAPTGYLLNEKWSRTIEVRANGQVVDLTTDGDVTPDDVVRGGVKLRKSDKDLHDAGYEDDSFALGGGNLAGATVEITNKSDHSVVVNGQEYQPGDAVLRLTSDTHGIWTTDADGDGVDRTLPYGTYEAKEVGTPSGYLLNEDWSDTFEVREDGVVVDRTAEGLDCPDQAIRGDIKFVKANEDTQERMAGIPFLLTSKTTGESHVIVTDANGTFDSSTISWMSAFFQGVNANDEALRADGTIDDSKLKPGAPIWFSGSTELEPKYVPGQIGALVFDQYELRELRCKANEGMRLIKTDVMVFMPHYTIDLGTLDNKQVGIATTLGFGHDMEKIAPAAADTTVTDKVEFENLERGHEYTLKGELHLLGADGSDEGVVATAEKAFTPRLSRHSVNVDFTLDTSAYTGRTLVCFEQLWDGDELMAEEADLTETEQQITIPSIKTTLTGDIDHEANAGNATQKLTDTVAYTGLEPGRSYQMTGTLHYKNTDGTDGGEVKGLDGQPVTKTVTFTPKAADGTVELEFVFDGVSMEGKTTVAFETLTRDGVTYATHADITDEDQTVRYPQVRTTATSETTGEHMAPGHGKQTINDEVLLSNLTVGKAYTVSGDLHLVNVGEDGTKSDGGVLAHGSADFTATAPTMTVKVPFEVDGDKLAGKTTVAFETLIREGVVVATHADLDDENQTVQVPKVSTQASDAADGDQEIAAAEEVTVNDLVHATNLVVGKEYTISGALHVKATDADGKTYDAGVATDKDGNPVTASTTFVADKTDMDVTLTFKADSRLLQGKSLVAFETLSFDGIDLYIHADINDRDQTVDIPDVKTTAAGKATEGHDVEAASDATVVDTVRLTNLTAGHEYTVTGTLHQVVLDEAGNKTDDGALVDADGNQIVATKTFTADKSDMELPLEFTIDGSALAGKSLVVFEDLAHEGVTLATHADITDEGQTVYIPAVKTNAISASTADHDAAVGDDTDKVTDTVTLTNLLPGSEYTVDGELHLVGDDGTDAGVVKNKDGKEARATTTVTPDGTSATVELTFDLDTADIAGKTVVAFETLSRNKVKVAAHADITDEDQSVHVPYLETTATDKTTGSHDIAAGKVTVADEVRMTNLIAGREYTVTGTLHVKDVDESGNISDGGVLTDADGNPVSVTKTFTADAANTSVVLEFEVDASELSGKSLVAFETLSRDGHELYVHADITDEDQTVNVPSVGTKAASVATGDDVMPQGAEEKLSDTVSLKNLTVGNEYTVTGTLHKVVVDESGNKTDGGELADADGKVITATTTFTADKADMDVTLEFTVDTSALAGQDIVAFESLSAGGVELATHADASDEGQTVNVPGVATKALDKFDGDHEIAGAENQTVVDHVSATNLVVGREYTISGTLHVKGVDEAGNTVDEGELKDASGKAVTATTTFTAKEENETHLLEFNFDASLLGGKDVVAFEELHHNEVLVAAHADITDLDQTDHVPSIGTLLTDAATDRHESQVPADGAKVKLVDKVAYKNLTAGTEYTLVGTLHVKGDDGTDGGEVKGSDGKAVSATTKFTPKASSGTVELEFEFDASALVGKTVVAFESVKNGEQEVATHADITDEAQSVHFVDLHTTATDKADGDKKLSASGTQTVVDKVEYTNLVLGREYTLTGTLHGVTADGKDGGVAKDADGNEIRATMTFTPTEPNGSVDLEFTFKADGFAGAKLVAFETLSVEGVDVATHADITDEAQTVEFEKPVFPIVNTGQEPLALVALGCGAGLVALAAAGVVWRRRERRMLE